MRSRLTTISGGLSAVLVLPFALATAGSGFAATRTWTGAGGDANWTTAANWGGIAPSAGDDLVFPGGAAQIINNNDFAAGTQFNSIAFNGSSGGYNLNGNAIRLMAGLAASNSAGTNFVDVAIQAAASQTFLDSTPYPDDLIVSGSIDMGAYSLTLAPSSGASLWTGAISGSGGVTASGSGLTNIYGACTYTGPTTVVGNSYLTAVSLSAASAVTVTSGSFLEQANGNSVGPVTVNPGGTLLCGGGGINQIANVASLTLGGGSVYWMDLYGVSNYGRVNASGAVDLGGATLQPVWAFTSSLGDQFLILNKTSPGAITGTFVGLPEGSTFPSNGRTYRISYVAGDGNDVVITDVTGKEAIPAIGSAGAVVFLVLLGTAAFLLLRRQGA